MTYQEGEGQDTEQNSEEGTADCEHSSPVLPIVYLGGLDAVFAPLPLQIMWGYGHWEKGQTPTYLAGLLSISLGFGT